jgi:hypothetical protein
MDLGRGEGCLSSVGVSTLVVSDLHLGSPLRHDVLTQPEPLDRLLEALERVELLVLLGMLSSCSRSGPSERWRSPSRSCV